MQKTIIEAEAGLWVCPDCGCADIQGTAWLHLNSWRALDGDPPSDDYWCPACDEHVGRAVILASGGIDPETGRIYEPYRIDDLPPPSEEVRGLMAELVTTREKLQQTATAALRNRGALFHLVNILDLDVAALPPAAREALDLARIAANPVNEPERTEPKIIAELRAFFQDHEGASPTRPLSIEVTVADARALVEGWR